MMAMRNRCWGVWCASLLVVSLLVTASVAEDDPYQVLKRDVGEWQAEMKMFGPGTTSEPVKGVERNRMLGNFWIVSDFSTQFMGQKFEGHGCFGYDTEKKKYVSLWIDSMSPFPVKMTGTWDADSNTMTFVGKGKDPSGNEISMKNVTKYDGKDRRVFTMYMGTPDGKWVKSMEITYTRKSGG